MRIILTIACVAVLGSLGCGFKSESVDLIVHNGNILTLDFQNNRAQALAVRDGRIIDGKTIATLLYYQTFCR